MQEYAVTYMHKYIQQPTAIKELQLTPFLLHTEPLLSPPDYLPISIFFMNEKGNFSRKT